MMHFNRKKFIMKKKKKVQITFKMSFHDKNGQDSNHSSQGSGSDLEEDDIVRDIENVQDDDPFNYIRNVKYGDSIKSIHLYFDSLPKIRDCVISLNDKMDGLESSLKENLSNNIIETLTDSLKETLTMKFTNIIDDAFHNYEIQEFQSCPLANCEVARWININLPNFRFVQIKMFFDLVFDNLIQENKVSAQIKPNRSAKRKRKTFYNHLNSWWDVLEPLLEDFMHTELYRDAIQSTEKELKLFK